jgi:hypothetical protein
VPIIAIFRNAVSRCPGIVQSAMLNQLDTGGTLDKIEVNSKKGHSQKVYKYPFLKLIVGGTGRHRTG